MAKTYLIVGSGRAAYITAKLKESIEKQRDFSNMDKLIAQEEKSTEDLSKLF